MCANGAYETFQQKGHPMTIEQLPQPGVRGGGCGCGERDLPEPTIDATAIPTVCVTRLSSALPSR